MIVFILVTIFIIGFILNEINDANERRKKQRETSIETQFRNRHEWSNDSTLSSEYTKDNKEKDNSLDNTLMAAAAVSLISNSRREEHEHVAHEHGYDSFEDMQHAEPELADDYDSSGDSSSDSGGDYSGGDGGF